MSSRGDWHMLKFIADKYYGIPTKIKEKHFIVPLHDAVVEYDITHNSWNELFKYPNWLYKRVSLFDKGFEHTTQILNHTIDCQNRIIYFIKSRFSQIGIIMTHLDTHHCQKMNIIACNEQNSNCTPSITSPEEN